MKKTYNISELAQEFGITTRSIRYYEDFGLLSPSRNGTTRIYTKRERTRLKLTLRGKRLGFSLADIKGILNMYDGTALNSRKQITATIEMITEKKAELDQQMIDINALKKELSTVEARFRSALIKINSKKK